MSTALFFFTPDLFIYLFLWKSLWSFKQGSTDIHNSAGLLYNTEWLISNS